LNPGNIEDIDINKIGKAELLANLPHNVLASKKNINALFFEQEEANTNAQNSDANLLATAY
tara:strand:+ start:871 stop:1053 length:183 start_codon:yes stop_codon:yes gene_type:complete